MAVPIQVIKSSLYCPVEVCTETKEVLSNNSECTETTPEGVLKVREQKS